MGCIVERNKGLLLPVPFIEKVVAANTACMGFAFATDNDIITATLDEGADVELVQKTMEEYKDHPVIYHFGHMGGKPINKDDIQPFTIIKNDGGEPVIVAFLDGTFPQFKREASEHTAEFFVALTHLQPKFQKVFTACEQTVKKFMDEMADTVFAQDMLLACGGKGSITILASNGEIVRWTSDPDCAKFEWGRTTNTYGYAEGQYPDKTEDTGTKSRLQIVGKKAAPAAAKPTSVPPTKPAVTAKPGPAAVQLVPDKPETAAGTRTYTCPREITNKHEKKRRYHQNAGWCPSNFKEWPTVEVRLPIKALDQIKDAAAAKPAAAAPPPVPKNTDTKHLAKPAGSTVREFVPVIATDKLKAAHDILFAEKSPYRAYFDNTGKAMPIDPKKIAEAQTKFPPAWEQLGLNSMEATMGWDVKDYHAMDHDILAAMCSNLSAALIEELVFEEDEEAEQRKAM